MRRGGGDGGLEGLKQLLCEKCCLVCESLARTACMEDLHSLIGEDVWGNKKAEGMVSLKLLSYHRVWAWFAFR